MNDITFPAEWELDSHILLALPNPETDWNYILPEAVDQWRRLLHALDSNGEKCILLVSERGEAERILADVPLENTIFIEMPYNDTWTRDYGPISVMRYGRLRALDFGFNGWGLKFAADRDNLVNLRLAREGLLAEGAYRNLRSFILEGGSIETDGAGTLLTTTTCLLQPNRNGGMSKAEIADTLCRELGVDHILWLEDGRICGDDTDSHIDTLCRLAPSDTIIFTGCRGADNFHFEALLRMRAQLMMFRNPVGEPYNLLELPLPDPIYEDTGERLPATYANYLVTKRNIFMPVYGQPQKDELACQTVRIAFPEHKVVPVDCRTLIRQHGSLHCSTMQIPSELIRF